MIRFQIQEKMGDIWKILFLISILCEGTYAACYYYYSYYYSSYRSLCYYSYYYYYYYYYNYYYYSDDDDSSLGIIIGASVGGVVGFGILSTIVIIICRTVCRKPNGARGIMVAPAQPTVVTASNNQSIASYPQQNVPMPPPAYPVPSYPGQPLPSQQVSTTATVGTYAQPPPSRNLYMTGTDGTYAQVPPAAVYNTK